MLKQIDIFENCQEKSRCNCFNKDARYICGYAMLAGGCAELKLLNKYDAIQISDEKAEEGFKDNLEDMIFYRLS